jgi:cell division protein FtsI (penicillin-binding protein 3)
VDTGKGVYKMHGSNMKDHNWNKGGYGELTVSQVLEFSSNIGVSRLIDDAYHDHPEAYVDGLYREGVGIPLNLPFAGAGEPKVRRPEKKGKYWLNWSKTALPWMSIGYETMLPPISTLTFYNAIANGGCMVKPRFITAELCDGQVVREFPTEVIKPSICSKHTLYDIQDILEKVVSQGLGKKAGNGGKLFKVSGKTGTAQIASGGSYRNGVHRYMVSFCGYFPSEAPRYSCIVCIVKRGTPASGGSQAGPVFRDISLYLMSKGVYRNTEEAADSNSVYTPEVLKGSAEKTETLLKQMNLRGAQFENAPDTLAKGRVPNFIGMGASDAVYEAQKRGLKVRITGVGRVMAQDISAGSEVTKGKTITLTLK